MKFLHMVVLVGVTLCCGVFAAPSSGKTAGLDPSLYQELRYRLIGPFRAGRTVGAVGIPTQPGVFFVGVNNGGVWKTDDFGRTWQPIFDQAASGSVGDIAVSPSQPNVLYVGSGEGLHRPDLSIGDGIFKSTDAGNTWQHIGLPDIQQVGRLIVHPTDPETVFVAGMGHPYGANDERGVFRTRNGGRSWDKVLFVNHNTGASQVEFDPSDARIVYAALWEHREGPWENGSYSGPNSGLYKSIDSGTTWRRLALPVPRSGDDSYGSQIIFAIAPSNATRLYAMVGGRASDGVLRSDDGGETWAKVSEDKRLGVDLRVHPSNPDVVFAAGTASYRSDDGGKTWTAIKGAPGGDDYQRIWINPLQPEIMLFTADQGATITTNGGRSWSSWYNQPTAQLYHVTTDNQFPFWIYGGQQESGAIGIASRGNGGQISFRDWIGVGIDEYAYVAPDPRNPDIVYGGRVQRFNKHTGQSQNVAPESLRSGKYRIRRTMPLLFHPADASMLLFATNVLWKTTNGGEQWQIISPDLSRDQPAPPASIGDYLTPALATMARRGVIYAVGPSPRDVNTLWAGTDDGLIHISQDGGKNWRNVTPPELRPWDKVSQLVAGHTDVNTAYAAINAIRNDDLQPHIYKTHDGGSHWTQIVSGIDTRTPVNVVREDPKQPGLLYAGTEREVYFSIDDGQHWQSLRMNMPASSVRDLVINGDDLVVGTHGRSIWILDNIAPLRELAKIAQSAKKASHLFAPSLATRVRLNMFSDTPLPPEESAGSNPPDGAVFDYFLARPARTVAIEIRDSSGNIVRTLSSQDSAEIIDTNTLPYPRYWFRPFHAIPITPGHHRIVWDLRYAPPPGAKRQYAIAAIYQNTPSNPVGPFVPPGRYNVRLTADGIVSNRPLEVRMDPRVTSSAEDIQLQTDLSMACYQGYLRAQRLRDDIDNALQQRANGSAEADTALWQALRGTGEPSDPDPIYSSITAEPDESETVIGLQEKFLYLLNLLQAADVKPTTQAQSAAAALQNSLNALETRWNALH